jgi:hypothetical protein
MIDADQAGRCDDDRLLSVRYSQRSVSRSNCRHFAASSCGTTTISAILALKRSSTVIVGVLQTVCLNGRCWSGTSRRPQRRWPLTSHQVPLFMKIAQRTSFHCNPLNRSDPRGFSVELTSKSGNDEPARTRPTTSSSRAEGACEHFWKLEKPPPMPEPSCVP